MRPDPLTLPAPYYLFRLLTGVDHMHFGMFRDDAQHPGAAQEDMMQFNLFFRPKDRARVLDVGAGLGATARWLARHGMTVTSISPDVPLIEYARLAASEDADPPTFLAESFEAFRSERRFDWVLFQESFQYFDDPVATVEKAVSLLEPGGRLQIGDQFLHVDLPRERARFPYLPRVLETCRRLGLERYCQCDISRAAYRMTSACLAELRRRRAELIAAHSQRRPEITKDIDDMLSCGTLEYDAYRAGHLSYQILTFDRTA